MKQDNPMLPFERNGFGRTGVQTVPTVFPFWPVSDKHKCTTIRGIQTRKESQFKGSLDCAVS